jgi:hypothetical protein
VATLIFGFEWKDKALRTCFASHCVVVGGIERDGTYGSDAKRLSDAVGRGAGGA